jgi:hypothetical protein
MERPEEVLNNIRYADPEQPHWQYPISASEIAKLRDYVMYLETKTLINEPEAVREVAEQLIRDGWYSGSLEELVDTARRLAK